MKIKDFIFDETDITGDVVMVGCRKTSVAKYPVDDPRIEIDRLKPLVLESLLSCCTLLGVMSYRCRASSKKNKQAEIAHMRHKT